MGARIGRWIRRRATSPVVPTGDWWSHRATSWLCQRLQVDDDPEILAAVAEVACCGTDDWASDQAWRAIDRRGADGAFLRRSVVAVERAGRSCPDPEVRRNRLPALVGLLLSPAPADTAYQPPVRLVWCLEASTDLDGSALASRMVWTAMVLPVGPVRDGLFDVLRTTDQPDLLQAVQDVFADQVGKARRRGSEHSGNEYTRSLIWHGDQPTSLTSVVLANPHLPAEIPDDAAPADGWSYQAVVCRVLIAVLKGDPDPVPVTGSERVGNLIVTALLVGIDIWAPERFAAACRRALRAAPPGPVREALCDRAALAGVPEARAAVLDAGHLPADVERRPAFLFLTGQWDSYDRVDPDGSRLRDWCAVHAVDAASPWRRRFEQVAAATGRADPCPRPKRADRGVTATGGGATSYGGSAFGGTF